MATKKHLTGDDIGTTVQAFSTGIITSDITGITGATQITNIVSISQADYDTITTPDASTYYIITD